MSNLTDVPALRQRPAFNALAEHHAELEPRHLRELFEADQGRGERLTAEGAGLFLDYSKNRITDKTLELLVQLADQAGLEAHPMRCSPVSGSTSPRTGRCCTWRCGCRAASRLIVDGVDVVAAVHEVLERMRAFADRIRSGEWKGHTGKPIRNVVNIGIGGSDLGPVMAYEALRHYCRRDMTFRFVSNVDSTDFVEATRDLDPARDAVHHFLEDVHDARDDDQCPVGARLGG